MTSTIAIAGGGLSGLVLARILQLHDIPCTVYEADASADARSQGGSLDMHVESGQLALREAGLYDEFRRNTHPQGEAMRVLDKAGVVYIDEPSKEGDGVRPEIDRTVLRDLLIESLDPGRIAWGHKVTAVRTRDDGRHELTFANGTSVAADLLVGADGTWSKVRPLVSAAKPEYTGISYLELHITDAKRRHPDSAKVVGTGILFALSDNKAIMGHGGEHIHLGASLRVPANWLANSEVNWTDATEAKAALQAEFADWSTDLTDLIRNSDDTIVPRPIHALPTDHSWPRVPGVTLIGDAAHVMSPFAGEGANLAMLDATELALAIVSAAENAVAQHEKAPSDAGKAMSQNGNVPTAQGSTLPQNGNALDQHEAMQARHDAAPGQSETRHAERHDAESLLRRTSPAQQQNAAAPRNTALARRDTTSARHESASAGLGVASVRRDEAVQAGHDDGAPVRFEPALGDRETGAARFEVALARYEAAMLPRARAAAEGSAQGLALCFAADSPAGLVNFFAGLAEM